MQNITIDFNTETKSTFKIANLKLTPDLTGFRRVQRAIYRNLGGKKAQIEEIYFDYQLPENFIVKDDEFFCIIAGGRKYFNKIEHFEVDPKGNDIDISVDASNLIDIKEEINKPVPYKKYHTSYKIFARLQSDEDPIFVDEDELEITAIPVSKEFPILKKVENLAKSKDLDSAKIEHKAKNQSKEVFQFTFANPAELKFANPVSGTIRLIVENERGAVSDKEIFLKGEFRQGHEYDIDNLKKGNVHKVSLVVNFNEYKNPLKSEIVKFKVMKANSRDGDGVLFEGKIEIEPDRDRTELGFEVIHNEKNLAADIHDYPEQQNIKLENPLYWSIGGTGDIEIAIIKFWNKASSKEPFGTVRIHDLKINFYVKDQTGGIARHNDWLKKDYSVVEDFEIQNGSRSNTFALYLPTKNINKEISDDSSGYIEIQFDYEEIQEEFGLADSKNAHLKIKFSIKRRVDKWLALDFGTSAIAAAISDSNLGLEDNIRVLDLNAEHKKIKGEHVEFEEKHTSFLSSLMYLDIDQKAKEDNVTVVNENLLQFSPINDVKIEKKFKFKVIPNLKMILGHDLIKFKFYPYIQIKDSGDIYESLPVNLILKHAYRHLFEKYIIPSVISLYPNMKGQSLAIELYKSFGNIVITIPNTFNQMHKNIIKDLILNYITWDLVKKNVSPESDISRRGSLFFEDKIKFVNESDAVAFYYLEAKRWNFLNKNREQVKSAKEEYILIYDIGAGTTDISYIKTTRKNDKFSVESLGNIGTIQAGNCLDTTIARIIDLKAHIDNKRSFINGIKLFESANKSTEPVVFFRDAIKTKLKLKISDSWENNKDFAFEEIEQHFRQAIRGESKPILDDLKEILHVDLFKRASLIEDFIHKISFKLISKLINISDPGNVRGGKLKVDTVILSGRTIQFTPLKEKLQAALLEKTTIDSLDSIIELSPSELKNSVVKGALQFIQFDEVFTKKREISAYYGLLWQDKPWGENPYSFKLLLKPGDELSTINDKIASDYDGDIFELDAGSVNMKNAQKIMLIKSFQPNPEIDYGYDRSDMFTKILEIKKHEISDTSKVPVKLIFDKNFTFKLKAGSKISEPTGINAFSLDQDLTYEENTWPFNDMINLSKVQKELIEDIKNGKVSMFIDGRASQDQKKHAAEIQADEAEKEALMKEQAQKREEYKAFIKKQAQKQAETRLEEEPADQTDEANQKDEAAKIDEDGKDISAPKNEEKFDDRKHAAVPANDKDQRDAQKEDNKQGDDKSETKKKRRPFI